MNSLKGRTVTAAIPPGADLVGHLNQAAAKHTLAPWVAALLGVAGAATLPWGIGVWLAAVPIVWWLALYDRRNRTVAVHYELGDEAERWYGQLTEAVRQLKLGHHLWRIETAGFAESPSASAGTGIDTNLPRQPIHVSIRPEYPLVSNLRVPTFSCGTHTLSLLPDRVLARAHNTFSDATYDLLTVSARKLRFTEQETLPDSAQIVDHTWLYTNKDGSPDRRRRDNQELPIVEYGLVEIKSKSGARWCMLLTDTSTAHQIVKLLSDAPRDVSRTHH